MSAFRLGNPSGLRYVCSGRKRGKWVNLPANKKQQQKEMQRL